MLSSSSAPLGNQQSPERNEQESPDGVMYGAPFSHLFTELKISPIEVHISAIELEISPIQLKISTIELQISPNRPI